MGNQARQWGFTEVLPGRFQVSDGLCQFELHQLIDGGITKRRARHPDGKTILSIGEARAYAEYITSALNTVERMSHFAKCIAKDAGLPPAPRKGD